MRPTTISLAALGLSAGCALAPTREPRSVLELRHEGAVLQAHEYSCGAAALATLMSYFGRPATEKEVLDSIFGKDLPVVRGPDGQLRLRALNLGDLEKAARAAGFKVVSVQVPAAKDLAAALEALKPAIARMYLYEEFPHFVVLRDIQGDWVHVVDPAYGNVRLTTRQFLKAWEAGDGVLMAIGRLPFQAWKTRDDKPVYLRRDEKDAPDIRAELDPSGLYRSVHRRVSQIGTFPRELSR